MLEIQARICPSDDKIRDFLQGAHDLISDCSAVYEDLHQEDGLIGINFHTNRHEYTVSLDWTVNPLGSLYCVRWHGSGESDIAEGSLDPETWKSFRAAIEKEDAECEEYHVDFKQYRLRRISEILNENK